MWKVVYERLRQGHRTHAYPRLAPTLPARFRGRPELRAEACADCAGSCAAACPVQALQCGAVPVMDLGRCLFCGACARACPAQAITFGPDFRLAASARADLQVSSGQPPHALQPLDAVRRRLYGRSFKLRQVSAGGCNACEADANVLSTLAFDMGRFGISFVASPRHADALLVTGPVTRNMREALLKTYDALAEPKVVIASGACAIDGGPYHGGEEVEAGGVAALIPVDLFVPGCPPHPWTLLDGMLRLLGVVG